MTIDAPAPSAIGTRKDDHLTLAARPDAVHEHDAGFRAWRLAHRALPDRDLPEVDLATVFLGRTLSAPVLVSAMTGGTDRAEIVNRRLAEAAVEVGLGMALGSGRALLLDPALRGTYVPGPRPGLLLANLGAVQLRLGLGPDDAERLVELVDADGLILHLNPVQEAIQPHGDTTFGGLLGPIAAVVERLAPRAVVVKEVGFGLAPDDVRALVGTGVAAVDVAGAGGTNWALIEGQRDVHARAVATAFRDWGWPTARLVPAVAPIARAAGLPLIASGGIGDGVEAAIALALGANMVGLARPFLLAALEERTTDAMRVVVEQLRIAAWAAGAARPSDLSPDHLQPA